MAQYSFAKENAQQSNNRSPHGDRVTLLATEFDKENNAISGMTKDGEMLTVRLANKDEYADHFVNRTKFTTEDARLREAGARTNNRMDVAGIESKMPDGQGAIQFQGVRNVGTQEQPELISRWMESVSTKPEDTYTEAQVQIVVPKSNDETKGNTDRRRVDMVMDDTSTAASMDALNDFTRNRITGDDGKTLDGQIRSAVFVATQPTNEPNEMRANLVWTGFDKESKSFEAGGEKLFDRPLNDKNFETMVPLAAAVGVKFEDLKFDDRVNQDKASQLFEATEAGNVKVAVAQGATSFAMPRATEKLIKSEQASEQSNGNVPSMSDRGFFKAQVGFRSASDPKGEYPDSTSVKTILQDEFLPAKNNDAYSPKWMRSMGHDIMAKAEQSGAELTVQQAPQPKPSNDNAAKFAPASSNSL